MGIIDLVFPKKCLECGRGGRYICKKCLNSVGYAKPICSICQRYSWNGKTHNFCLSESSLDGLVSIWNYEKVIRKAIIAFKYKYATDVAKELSRPLNKRLKANLNIFDWEDNPTLVPIPLYWQRQNFRGFNQSEVLGKKVARSLGWKYSNKLIIRQTKTTPQVELKGRQRKVNLKGAFTLNEKNKMPQNIILFDDVWTTGSTIKEAAKVLKDKGIKKVWGLTMAR